jgi:hypothetical protein
VNGYGPESEKKMAVDVDVNLWLEGNDRDGGVDSDDLGRRKDFKYQE